MTRVTARLLARLPVAAYASQCVCAEDVDTVSNSTTDRAKIRVVRESADVYFFAVELKMLSTPIDGAQANGGV